MKATGKAPSKVTFSCMTTARAGELGLVPPKSGYQAMASRSGDFVCGSVEPASRLPLSLSSGVATLLPPPHDTNRPTTTAMTRILM